MKRAIWLPLALVIGGALVLAGLNLSPSPSQLSTPISRTDPETKVLENAANNVSTDTSDSLVERVGASRSLPYCGQDDGDAVECMGRWLSMRFDSEERQDSWADATERTIVDGLTQLSGITTVTSLIAECRESVCRVQLAFPAVEYVPTKGPPERDATLVSTVFLPLLHRAGMRPLIVPYPRDVDLPERTYYFSRP
jgi:hypothetical protein